MNNQARAHSWCLLHVHDDKNFDAAVKSLTAQFDDLARMAVRPLTLSDSSTPDGWVSVRRGWYEELLAAWGKKS